jgi:ribonuclease T1
VGSRGRRLGPVGTAARRARAGLPLGLLLAAALAAGIAAGCGGDGTDSAAPAPEPASPAQLTPDEREQIALVLKTVGAGGPFRHEQDGETFFNREGLLPDRPMGHYREYTVETPGSEDRGARRLVIGADGETFYTRDHYSSFVKLDPERFP